MEFLREPPQWLLNALPEGGQEFLKSGGWWGLLGLAALLLLLLLWGLASRFVGLFRRRPEVPAAVDLQEQLASYPALPPSTGDRRLLVEGVPVRLRLVVAAPAGIGTKINREAIETLLDHVRPGLGGIAAQDQPCIRIWPAQLSYEGFANTFHSNTVVPEGEKKPTPWVLLAGRAIVGNNQVMLGLGLLALAPTTVGRRTLKAHEWDTVLRVRVRD
jgi:hypothetical protein